MQVGLSRGGGNALQVPFTFLKPSRALESWALEGPVGTYLPDVAWPAAQRGPLGVLPKAKRPRGAFWSQRETSTYHVLRLHRQQ